MITPSSSHYMYNAKQNKVENQVELILTIMIWYEKIFLHSTALNLSDIPSFPCLKTDTF